MNWNIFSVSDCKKKLWRIKDISEFDVRVPLDKNVSKKWNKQGCRVTKIKKTKYFGHQQFKNGRYLKKINPKNNKNSALLAWIFFKTHNKNIKKNFKTKPNGQNVSKKSERQPWKKRRALFSLDVLLPPLSYKKALLHTL